MYVNKKLCLLLMEFLMMVDGKAEHDHLDKESSDVRYSGKNYKADDKNSCEKELRKCRDVSDEILSRRIVNMLLSRINLKEDNSWFNGRVELEGTASELETLNNFGLGIATLQEVAPILDDVIKTTEFGGVYECGLCLQSLRSQLFNFIGTYKQYIPFIFLGLFLIRTLRDKEVNFLHIAVLLFFCTWTVRFAVLFADTLREVEQELDVKEAPIHCRPNEMSWTDKVMALFASADDCKRYEAEMNNREETILKLGISRTLDQSSWQMMALSINICFTIIKFLSEILLGLVLLLIALLKACSMTTLLTLTLVLYGFYLYHSTTTRRWEQWEPWEPERNLNNAIHEEVFLANPTSKRNRRRKQKKETLY